MARATGIVGGLLHGFGQGMVSQAEARRQEGLERAREYRRQLERQEDRTFQTERDEAQRTFLTEQNELSRQATKDRDQIQDTQRRDEIDLQHKNRLREIEATGAEARKTASEKPRSGFRMLSADEIKAAGLPEGTSAQIDEATGKIDVVNKPPGGGGLPVGALKIVDEAKQSLGAVKESAALIDRATSTLSSGKVDLGLVSNAISRSRNKLGASSPESRAYSDVLQTFEKLRNNYLLLAKGVQTEGDATRAWNSEIGESAQNDNDLALQQLKKARQMIENMEGLQQNRIDTIYANYGATPPGGSENPPASGRPSSPQPKNSKGWPLMIDAQGNRAYVSPDGKQFEEVK